MQENVCIIKHESTKTDIAARMSISSNQILVDLAKIGATSFLKGNDNYRSGKKSNKKTRGFRDVC
jgi:hypothetical protein